MAINIHAYPSTFTHETRILKETESLAASSLFEKILITALWEPGLKEMESLDAVRDVWRVKLSTRSLPSSSLFRALRFLEWMMRIVWRFRRDKVEVVSCHCLAVLPLGVAFRLLKKSKVVYETHELETERHGWSASKRKIARIIERTLMRFVDRVVVVGPSIKTWYETTYNLANVHVVRAVPRIISPINSNGMRNVFREKFSLGNNELIFLYHGVLGTGRSVENLLSIFSTLEQQKHLVLMGYGPLESKVKDYASRFGNIHFHPPVPPYEVICYCCSADVGLSLFEPTCLSYLYSCPNKMFEYILGGVPVIVSAFPDMGAIVDEFECGWKVEINEIEIEKLICSISNRDVENKRAGTERAQKCLSWEAEAQELLRGYRLLLGPSLRGKVATPHPPAPQENASSVINEL